MIWLPHIKTVMGIANYGTSNMPALGLGCRDPLSRLLPIIFWTADLRPRVRELVMLSALAALGCGGRRRATCRTSRPVVAIGAVFCLLVSVQMPA